MAEDYGNFSVVIQMPAGAVSATHMELSGRDTLQSATERSASSARVSRHAGCDSYQDLVVGLRDKQLNGFGPSNEIALREVDAKRRKLLEYLRRFDTLSDRQDTKRARHFAYGFDHASVHWIGVDVTDELAVDLQIVNGQGFQIMERG
jgi:hypothetical protein